MPAGAAAVAAPPKALVPTAVSRVGAPSGGMLRGRLLEAGTTLLPTRAVAVTTLLLPAVGLVKESWMDVLFFLTQLAGAALRQMLTMYSETAWLLVGGVSRTVAMVGPVGFAAAIVGAPAWGVRMARALAPGTSLPAAVIPTTQMVSAGPTKLELCKIGGENQGAEGSTQGVYGQAYQPWPPSPCCLPPCMQQQLTGCVGRQVVPPNQGGIRLLAERGAGGRGGSEPPPSPRRVGGTRGGGRSRVGAKCLGACQSWRRHGCKDMELGVGGLHSFASPDSKQGAL